jgi:abnormal spindle-like microcephaly-associated protein
VATPGGVCLDLSNMFQKAHARPPPRSAVAAKLPPLPTTVAPSSATVAVMPASQAQQQCESFTAWLNATLCPVADATAEAKENDPWRSLAVHQRMARIRQQATALWQSTGMQKSRQALEDQVVRDKLQIRKDRDLYADLTHRKAIVQLLLESYEAPWLRLGLETLFGQAIEPGVHPKSPGKRNKFDRRLVEKKSLSRMQVTLRDFIVHRVLSDEKVLAKYTKGKCKVPSGRFEVEYKAEMRQLVLYRLVVLFFFLDQVKVAHVLEETLFRRDSPQKSSKDMLLAFSRLFLAHQGDVVKQLSRVGLRVFHKQAPLDELQFAVQNLATDLRDGVCLARLVEVLTASPYQSLLKTLRLPAVSRLPKLHNVGVVLQRLGKEFPLPAAFASHHVVDGHREKVLQLLWALVAHYCLPQLMDARPIQGEIQRIEAARGIAHHAAHPVDEASSTPHLSEPALIQLLLRWTNAVVSTFGLSVANLSTDWADGVICCLLIHYYHPELIAVKEIRATEGSNFAFSRKLLLNAPKEEIRQNEQTNWQLASQGTARLGALDVLPSTDTDHPPHERTMLMGLAFLCHRLLESSVQVRACCLLQATYRRKRRLADWSAKISATRIIVRAWQTHKENYYRAQREKYTFAIWMIEGFVQERKSRLQELQELRLQREEYHVAATLLQALLRRSIARDQYRQLVSEHTAATLLQSLWRRVEARQQLLELRTHQWASTTLQAWWRRHLALQRVRMAAAVQIQCRWRGFWCKLQYDILILDVMDLQKFIRRGLAAAKRQRRQASVAIIQRTFLRYQKCERAREERQRLICEKAATVCQKYIRRYLDYWKYHQEIRSFRSARRVQTCWRRHVIRFQFLQYLKDIKKFTAAQRIQSWWRSMGCRSHFVHLCRASILAQSAFRRHVCRQDFARLRGATLMAQALWRGRAAQESFLYKRHSVITCQAIMRAFLARREKALRLHALVRLQSLVRMYQSKILVRRETAKRSSEMHTAAVIIQNKWRSFSCHKRFSAVISKAVLIQSFLRNSSASSHYARLKAAALILQSGFRMCLSRRELLRRRLAFEEQVGLECLACKLMQSYFRGHLVRSDMRKQHGSAVLLQKFYRTHTVRRNYQEFLTLVCGLQSYARMWIGQREAVMRNNAVLSAQRTARQFLAKRKFRSLQVELLEREASTIIQSCGRAFLARQHAEQLFIEKWAVEEREFAAVTVQRAFRSYMATFIAARSIQKTWRCYTVHIDFLLAVLATITIQSAMRRFLAEHQRVQRKFAVLVLQGFGRTAIQRRRRMLYLRCVVRIQASVRSCLVQAEQASRHFAASLVQRHVRGFLTRRQVYIQDVAAMEIQRAWRGFTVYTDYVCAHISGVIIQTAFRRHLARVRVDQLRTYLLVDRWCRQRSARVIQTTFRMYVQRRQWTAAATIVQRAWCEYRSRQVEVILRHSVVRLQCRYRGHRVRRHRSLKVRQIAQRLSRLKAPVNLRLAYRTATALEILANSTMLSEIMLALQALEVATRWSAVCSRQLVQAGATSTLFTLIRTCNRSLPHMKVLQLILQTLLNVCHHTGWDDSCPDGVDVCVDLVQMFRDKPAVFGWAVSLLEAAVHNSSVARAWCGSHETLKRLQAVLALCVRKIRVGGGLRDPAMKKSVKTLQRIVRFISGE